MEVDTWRSLLLYKLVLSRVVFLISLETAVCKEIESRSPGRKQEIHPEGSRNLDLLLSSYFTPNRRSIGKTTKSLAVFMAI